MYLHQMTKCELSVLRSLEWENKNYWEPLAFVEVKHSALQQLEQSRNDELG